MRLVNLWVSNSLMDKGYFVLSDVVTKLPKDASVKYIWISHSTDHQVLRMESKEFPEIPSGDTPPRADFQYNVNSGASIQWPTREYEDIMLKLLNAEIKKTVEPEDLGVSFEQLQRAIAEGMTRGLPEEVEAISTGCKHEWFMYGRTAAHKHCKKCGAVRENA